MTQLKGVPRSHIYRLLRSGQVRVNKGRIKPPYKLQLGDAVTIPPVRMLNNPRQRARYRPQLLRQATLFENDDLLVINKPAGLPVHAGSGIHYGVIEAFKAVVPGAVYRTGAPPRPRHQRLSTTGEKPRQPDPAARHDARRARHRKTLSGAGRRAVAGPNTVDVPLEKIQRSGEHMVEASRTVRTRVAILKPETLSR